MARLVLIGDVAEVELTTDDEDDQIIATCAKHPGRWQSGGCGWTERYDGMDDATECAADHADGGRQK
jgi:hypothetical protein